MAHETVGKQGESAVEPLDERSITSAARQPGA